MAMPDITAATATVPFILHGYTSQLGRDPAFYKNESKSFRLAETLGVNTHRDKGNDTLSSSVKLQIPIPMPDLVGCCPTSQKPTRISLLLTIKAPPEATDVQVQDALLHMIAALEESNVSAAITKGKPLVDWSQS